MATSQLTVSAIRQHFESTCYVETADTSNTRRKHAVPPKPESVMQKKQPPKTKPKPKTSVILAAQSSDTAKSATAVVRPCQSVVHSELEPRLNANDEYTDSDISVLPENLNKASDWPHVVPACEDEHTAPSRLLKQSSADNPPLDDPIQTTPVLAKSVSRDEVEIVRPSPRNNVSSRWVTSSSLLPQSDVVAPSTNDVKEAIVRAKQKPVLHRILGMKLEDESLPQQTRETANNNCKATSPPESVGITEDAEMNELRCETPVDVDPLVNTPASLLTDDDTNITDDGSTPAAVVYEPKLLSDACEQNVTIEDSASSPTPTVTVPSADVTITNEENDCNETESSGDTSRHDGEKIRRPISMYPQEIQQPLTADSNSRLSVIDVPSSLSAGDLPNDNCIANHQTSLPQLRTAPSPPVATSRKSYVALTQFVGEKFSFLDDFDDAEETEEDF